jgi:hypothetical protein
MRWFILLGALTGHYREDAGLLARGSTKLLKLATLDTYKFLF